MHVPNLQRRPAPDTSNSAAAEPFENLCSCGYSGRPDRRNNPLPRILLPFPVINVDKKNVSLINLRRK